MLGDCLVLRLLEGPQVRTEHLHPRGCLRSARCVPRQHSGRRPTSPHVPAARSRGWGDRLTCPRLLLLELTSVPWSMHATFVINRILEGQLRCSFLPAAGPDGSLICIRTRCECLLWVQRRNLVNWLGNGDTPAQCSWVDQRHVSITCHRAPSSATSYSASALMAPYVEVQRAASWGGCEQALKWDGLTFKSQLCHMAVCPWGNYLTSLNLVFLSYRVVM